MPGVGDVLYMGKGLGEMKSGVGMRGGASLSVGNQRQTATLSLNSYQYLTILLNKNGDFSLLVIQTTIISGGK